MRHQVVEEHQGAHAGCTLQTLQGCLVIEVGIVPSLVGWLITGEPGIAVQFYGGISECGILVYQEVVFATHILQVALVALFAHEVALAERHVGHVTAVAITVLGTAKQIECLADAVEAANALGLVVQTYVSQNQMVRVLAVACHGGQPLVVLRLAGRLGEDNPLILSRLYAQRNLQLLAAHIAGTLRDIRIV